MPIRNLWSLQPGECLVANEVITTLDVEVFFPIKDVGIDLLVVRNKKHIGIQVKESRYYGSGNKAHSWHQLSLKKHKNAFGSVDFYIFLTYLPYFGEHKISEFKYVYLIVPYDEIDKRIILKDSGIRNIYRYYFHFENEFVIDLRTKNTNNNNLKDYGVFLNAWNLIDEALNF